MISVSFVAVLSEPRSTFKKQTQTESTEVPPCHVVTVSPGASGTPGGGRATHGTGRRARRSRGHNLNESFCSCVVTSSSPEFSLTRSCSKLAQGWPRSLCPQSPPCPHPVLPSAALPACQSLTPVLLIPLITGQVPFPWGMSEIPSHTESLTPRHSLPAPFPHVHSAEPPLL